MNTTVLKYDGRHNLEKHIVSKNIEGITEYQHWSYPDGLTVIKSPTMEQMAEFHSVIKDCAIAFAQSKGCTFQNCLDCGNRDCNPHMENIPILWDFATK